MSQGMPSSSWSAPETATAASRLERHVEWSTGFWLAYVFTRSQMQASLLEERVKTKLAERSKALRVLRPSTPRELKTILEQLVAQPHPPCTWVEAVEEDSPAGNPGWTSAWTSFILRANERRELLRESLSDGLVLLAPTNLKSALRDAGPDLWSVRTFVFELPPSLEEQRDAILSHRIIDESDHRPRAQFVDHALIESDIRRLPRVLEALPAAAEALTHVKLAERLHSAGRYDEAAREWERAIAAHRTSSSQPAEGAAMALGASLMGLGDALRHDSRYMDAERAYAEAITMLERAHGTREHPDVAASLHGLGITLEAQGRKDEAERAYRAALEIAEHAGKGSDALASAVDRDLAATLATRRDGSDPLASLVDQLARVLNDEGMARVAASRIGFPREILPSFRGSSLAFWEQVVRAAAHGALAGGVQAIIDEVARMYPGNAYFRTHRSH